MGRKPFRVLAVADSLRQVSCNRGLLRAAQELAPEWVEVRIFDIGQFFNEDVEATGDPEPVRYFYEKFQPVGFSGLRICVLLVYLVNHSEFQQYSEAMKLGLTSKRILDERIHRDGT